MNDEFEEQFRAKLKAKIAVACKTAKDESEGDEEECVSCELSTTCGILLSYCEDEKLRDELSNKFLEGDTTLNELVEAIGEDKIPDDVLTWFQKIVSFDETLIEAESSESE